MKQAAECMRRGELVPDAIVWEMVRERVTCLRCDNGFILDGFPRTLNQAESLKQLMDSEGIGLTAVVNYALPLAEISTRLSGRRTCEKCKTVYHLIERPPKTAERCDRCDGKLFQREDDRPEAVQVRMETYERSIVPVAAFYTKLCLLVEVDAKGSPEEICEKTLAQLHAHWARRVGPVAARD
jgi:adenylate kinase